MVIGKEVSLPSLPYVCSLAELTPYFSMFVKAQERAGNSSRFVLITYSRIGEGYLEPRTTKGGLTLDVYQGKLSNYINSDQVPQLFIDGTSEFSPYSILQRAAQFFDGCKDELARQILVLDRPTFFVVYAGEEEKFRTALNLINKLSFLAGAIGKRDMVKFYLLTCKCDLIKKAEMTAPFCSDELLRYLVYNPNGSCGGLEDLQTIADAVLAAAGEVK